MVKTPELMFFKFVTEEEAKAFMNRQLNRRFFDAEFIKMYSVAEGWIVETAGDNRYYTYA